MESSSALRATMACSWGTGGPPVRKGRRGRLVGWGECVVAEACGEQVVDQPRTGSCTVPGRSLASRRRMVVLLTSHAATVSCWVSIGRELVARHLP
ncbi:hypothetical protein [[Kitasatospora] papulosa]|uniref:hypothetical protein n=1 Tax=[Kitasatospora] papulosa TaxID=1464011 RepID=UPI00403CDF72